MKEKQAILLNKIPEGDIQLNGMIFPTTSYPNPNVPRTHDLRIVRDIYFIKY